MSPEFSGLVKTRSIHYGFEATVPNVFISRWSQYLAEIPWQPHRNAANAASLLMEWINGTPLSKLENRFRAVRAGVIEGLCRDAAWCLSGFADVLAAATKANIEAVERPKPLRNVAAQSLLELRGFLPAMRLLVWRLNAGLPETVLWLTEAKTNSGRPLVARREASILHSKGFGSYEALRQRSNWDNVVAVLRAGGVQDAHQRAQILQGFANEWHMALREKMHGRQAKRLAASDAALLDAYYDERGKGFETSLERILTLANIDFTRFDDGTRPGAFDYLLHVGNRPDLALENKSKQGGGLVSLNEATDVLRAADLYGFVGINCVTLCQPGVDPNVPAMLLNCARLCVVEAHDLAEVLLLIFHQQASAQDLHDWLSQPGQAKLDTFAPTMPQSSSLVPNMLPTAATPAAT